MAKMMLIVCVSVLLLCLWSDSLNAQPIAGKWSGTVGSTTVTFKVNSTRTMVDSVRVVWSHTITGCAWIVGSTTIGTSLPVLNGTFSSGSTVSGTFTTPDYCVGSYYQSMYDNYCGSYVVVRSWTATPQTQTAVQAAECAPGEFRLSQNYPNPFNPSTTIEYTIPREEIVVLKVFDVLGREVALLVNGLQGEGVHKVSFTGDKLAGGVYFYRMDAGESHAMKKLILAK